MSDSATDGRYSIVEVQFSELREDYDPEFANAAVVILALARNNDEFRLRVASQLTADGFLLVDWGNIEPFDSSKNEWTAEVTRAAHEQLSAEWPVQYANFNTVRKDWLDA